MSEGARQGQETYYPPSALGAPAAVVDTNIYIHALIENSINHEKARKQLDSLAVRYLPIIVVYEITWVLRKLRLKIGNIDLAVKSILNNPATRIAPDDGEHTLKAIQFIISERLNMARFNDQVVLATAIKLNLPIMTYDNKLKREAKKKGLNAL